MDAGHLGLRSSDSLQPKLSHCGLSARGEWRNPQKNHPVHKNVQQVFFRIVDLPPLKPRSINYLQPKKIFKKSSGGAHQVSTPLCHDVWVVSIKNSDWVEHAKHGGLSEGKPRGCGTARRSVEVRGTKRKKQNV
jgi:hypothetical protein